MRDLQLLTTKLYIPPVRPELVPRSRLIERLDEGLRPDRKLTLVSAPAGFGKTTLLSEWARGFELPTAWLSLDEGDNDLARFWTYVIAAIRRVHADVGEAALAMLRSPQPPPITVILTDLINELALVPDPFVLVLDDLHTISEPHIRDALVFTLDNLPPQVHVVLCTRADPPWSLGRLRARGQMTELRAEDLRFNLEEAAAFLNDAMRLNLSPEEVAALDERTEGWIGGLQMAAFSMQDREDIPAFIRAFTGSNRYVLDYLVEEVLQRQPEHIQSFLLKTSILDRLCGPLCDAVLGNQQIGEPANRQNGFADLSGQAILEYLESANLFIVALDDRREWYRYHRLFGDLLRRRLGQARGRGSAQGTGPELIPELHRRASGWYEQCGASLGDNEFMMAAIEHALAAADFERAADLVAREAEAIIMQSYVATFRGWVERIPDNVVRTRSDLCYLHAFALLLSGYPLDAVEARLRDVETDSDGRGAALRAVVAASQGQLPEAIELSERALGRLSEDDLIPRSLATWVLSISRSAGRDIRTQSRALDAVVRMGRESGGLTVTVAALCYQAALCVRLGQLHKARAMFEQALETATTRRGRVLPVAGEAIMGLGELSREWNELEAAARRLEEGIELTKQWRDIAALNGYISLARVRRAQSDTDGAQEAIQKATQLATRFDAAEWDDQLVGLEQARLWLAQGNVSAAWQWVQAQGLDKHLDAARPVDEDDLVSQRLRKYEQLLLGRVLIAQNRNQEALALLEALQARMEAEGRVGMVIEIQVLKALASQAQGNVEGAVTALEAALSLAAPEGYVRIFIDEGAPMASLLRQAASHSIAPDYVAKLLTSIELETKDSYGRPPGRTKVGDLSAALPSSPVGASRKGPPPPSLGGGEGLVEPLSERELEVLRLIAAGLSNREIAEHLVIALSTVKTHVHNIYGKLGVSNRVQAVARATELDIF